MFCFRFLRSPDLTSSRDDDDSGYNSTKADEVSFSYYSTIIQSFCFNYLQSKLDFFPLRPISNWFDMREQAPGASLLHWSVSGASSLMCTEICLL